MPQTDTREPIESDAPTSSGELLFQRCLWCGTPAYRRSFCRACGSTAFRRERSSGAGVLVRRVGQVPLNTWFAAMDEGFTLTCQVTRVEPVVVAVGARVRVVRTVPPLAQGFPLVELTHRATSSDRW
ncbi:zinc ribbon domain-containing protein [Streptomyces sp. NPDC048420]|uniref:zinc ribbon domain-containing protein n=1 Tax=Streptomyces sp. NPDC048420 TaxID=3155755 RepID=UPI003436EE2D